MIAELALSAVALLIILQSLFLLSVALKSSQESSVTIDSRRKERITAGDSPRTAVRLPLM